MSDCFWGQTYVASPYIILDITAECWLVEFSGYKLTYFLDTKIACQQIVVMPANKLCPDDFRDIGEALVVQHIVNVIPASWVFRLGLTSLFVFGLELLQPQPHTTNIDNVKTFAQQLILEQVPKFPQLG